MSVDGVLLDDSDPARIRSLLASDAVGEIRMRIVPVIVGGRDAPRMTGLPDGFLPHDRYFRLKEMEQSGDELHCHYVRDRRRKTDA